MAISGVTSSDTPRRGDSHGRRGSPEAELLEAPAIVVAEEAPEVVDLPRVVRVVGDHRGDQPARRTVVTPVGAARSRQLPVVAQRGHMTDERLVDPLEPGHD